MGALGVFPFVEFVDKTPLAWAGLVGVAIVSTFMANYCYYNGLKYLEAGRASIVATLEPVVAALMAYLIFDEYFAPVGYLGVMLILGAVIATVTEKSKVKS
jgi:DME family drug/metabolite transporter